MSIYSRRVSWGRYGGRVLARGLTILSNPRSVPGGGRQREGHPGDRRLRRARTTWWPTASPAARIAISPTSATWTAQCTPGPRASPLSRAGRCPVYAADFRTMLDDKSVDAAIVALPPHWHPGDDLVLPGRQGRLLREAAEPQLLGRAQGGRAALEVQSHRPDRHAEPLRPPQPRRPRVHRLPGSSARFTRCA